MDRSVVVGCLPTRARMTTGNTRDDAPECVRGSAASVGSCHDLGSFSASLVACAVGCRR